MVVTAAIRDTILLASMGKSRYGVVGVVAGGGCHMMAWLQAGGGHHCRQLWSHSPPVADPVMEGDSVVAGGSGGSLAKVVVAGGRKSHRGMVAGSRRGRRFSLQTSSLHVPPVADLVALGDGAVAVGS